MKKKCLLFLLLLLFFSCRKKYEAPVPSLNWDLYNASSAVKLTSKAVKLLDGVYNISDGNDRFGNDCALKWSYTANGTDTTYNLSFFCQKDIIYFVCEGKRTADSSILLNGYWRRMIGTETGKVWLTIDRNNGAMKLLNNTWTPGDNLIITGNYGLSDDAPSIPVSLRYARPLYKGKPLEIVAHRGGGRSADLLPASENTVEIVKLASRFGATGIEIDVRLTSDGVPILFHDATLNERLIQKNGMVGPVGSYSYAQLTSLVRLINGERIPTLRDVLNTVVYNTALRYVWLDTKLTGNLQVERDLQAEFMQKAAAIGRTLLITIGIPDKTVLDNFRALPNYASVPSVNELTIDDVHAANSTIWGPRFTLGLQNDAVSSMHGEGRKVFVWTLDSQADINEFLTNGQFDGILSNYPSAVAYAYYTKQ
ncbi:glycerophosphodiester phosphodiesterase [Flavisolibacter ginsenosidimutans]|uniref:Glycerophosphodiester phosphodiesterase n=1 Tax=Flavisolibacter ginsenosidimutans TaxID=661481 RepID=A0A5B8ULE5_9BACT|nr:glycerophosphodiester phosphodiesterase [Flavisolibacter ginsenosidimutans]QEC57192.1 glycerophosphodiester phosphodiesterase [Flavisolibacter ginsenosidimutans]